MKLNSRGFTLVEGLLIVIAISLVTGVGYYVYNSNKDNQTKSNSQQSVDQSTNQTKPTENTNQSQKTDKELIIEAVKSYRGSDLKEGDVKSVEVKDIVGNNARGNFSLDPTGAAFIAHKDNGKWEVVFVHQGEVSQEIGLKYNLPSDWYSQQ